MYSLRMIKAILCGIWRKKANFFDPQTLTFRALPLLDCGYDGRFNNGMMAIILDVAKFDLAIKTKTISKFIHYKWGLITTSIELNIVKPIKVFTKFQVVSRLLGWKDGYLYLEHIFMAHNKLCASAITKIAVVHRGKKVDDESLAKLSDGLSSPPLPQNVLDLQKLISDEKESSTTFFKMAQQIDPDKTKDQ